MNLSAIFIRRPVATTLIMVSILVFGLAAYRGLPVSDLPSVDFPAILVLAQLPGADPETMASSVATPLERQFSTIAGVDQMTSTSTQGNTQITLLFNLNRNIDAAAQDVQAAISAAAPLLPPSLPSPPTYRKVNPADQPILYIALTSETMPLSAVSEYADTLIGQRISMVQGVAQVLIFGNKKYAVRIGLDPDALAVRQLGIDEVVGAVQQANVNLPTGILDGPDKAWTIHANGQLTQAAAYEPVIVAYRGGSPVRLRDVGVSLDSVENDKTAAWLVDREAIVLAIQRQPGTNTVRVSGDVLGLLPELREAIPASIEMEIVYERAESIRASVGEVQFTLVLALILVVLVIFLFLRNATATIIPSLALPMSIVGTFAVMYLLGYSLDNLSLLALTLSIGFVIDDAIVMLENVVRHLEMGKTPLQAAYDGSEEIGFTILSMTISLAAVFIPILFLGGIVGRLFREFAVTIGVAILISGAVALSLTPMAASLFLKRRTREPGRLYRWTEAAFERSVRFYDRWLVWSLDHPVITLLYSLAILLLSLLIAAILPKGFLPSEDAGQIVAFTEASEDISFQKMVEKQKQANRIMQETPAIETFVSVIGSVPGVPPNSGLIFARLKPMGQRPSAFEVVAGLRERLAQIPGIQAYPQVPPPIQLTGRVTRGLYQYALQGLDRDQLYQVSLQVEEALRGLPTLRDVSSDLNLSSPQLRVLVDRDEARSLGLTMFQIEDALYSAFGSRQISNIYTPTDTYQVILELQPRFRQDPDALRSLWLRGVPPLVAPGADVGQMVPLEAVAHFETGVGPLSVNHAGQIPAVTLSFNLPSGVSLGQAVEEIRGATAGMLPQGITAKFTGSAQAFQESLRSLGGLVVLAILVIYIVLGILYESFIHPLTILSALPFAGFGAVLSLWLFGYELNVYAFVGIVMLVGLVKKNGIMMVDFALEAEKGGADSRDAIHRACLVRFRPIMMTTVSALAGTFPIAVATGIGAESRRALGISVVGGLLFSQLLTLFVTPVIFVVLDRLRPSHRHRHQQETPPEGG